MAVSSTNFYNKFHDSIRSQPKVITSTNFTYINIINVLNKWDKSLRKGKVLDYGCGVGTVAFYLLSKGHLVTGVDVSKSAIVRCTIDSKRLGFTNSKFKTLSEFETKLKEKKQYSTILALEVIEHVENDIGLLRNFNKMLNKNGIMVLSVPSLNAPLFKIGLLGSFDKRVGHLRRYDLKGIKLLFKKTNFEILEIRPNESILRNSLFVFPKLGWVVRLLKWPLSTIVNSLDNFIGIIFGYSDFIIIAKKI